MSNPSNASNASNAKNAEIGSEASTRVLLHALTQILIEEGVVTREDFHHRVQLLRGDGATD